ncbi:hypothetical protein FHL15_007253 [Xylaria flabelliformis]|uniref:ATP synthase subunit delta, mitochondrial n=1 Tax=Xylaria flabelliformis TaxID=2512241 RepID=A0A553HVF8_9PEZI|nr:hypothetical protein FHL15_007253 [Xylaria flabelliformis]
MNAFRVARAALRARPAAMRLPIQPLQRRGYADAAPDKARITLHNRNGVVQVNIPAESGEMGVLANHVPSIEQLKPGLIEVIEDNGSSKQFFLSGGFATVQPNSVLSINAVEGYPLEDFSAEAVRSQIAEAQKVANGSGSEQDIAEAKIELEGYSNRRGRLFVMSSRSQRYAPIVEDGPSQRDYPVLDKPVPTRTVTLQRHRFCAPSSHTNSSSKDHGPAECERANMAVA